mmetsp:Transcript_5927/g.7757  ORF Transcript_5927/g.7757 Transcript_5927/m.7757 type:complete len:94 (-) Transcript_5927:1405-1686(-)
MSSELRLIGAFQQHKFVSLVIITAMLKWFSKSAAYPGSSSGHSRDQLCCHAERGWFLSVALELSVYPRLCLMISNPTKMNERNTILEKTTIDR